MLVFMAIIVIIMVIIMVIMAIITISWAKAYKEKSSGVARPPTVESRLVGDDDNVDADIDDDDDVDDYDDDDDDDDDDEKENPVKESDPLLLEANWSLTRSRTHRSHVLFANFLALTFLLECKHIQFWQFLCSHLI